MWYLYLGLHRKQAQRVSVQLPLEPGARGSGYGTLRCSVLIPGAGARRFWLWTWYPLLQCADPGRWSLVLLALDVVPFTAVC